MWEDIGHWFAYSFLDGLAGGLLGGAFAWVLLRKTIQSESRARAEDDLGKRRDEARRALAKVYVTLMSLEPFDIDRNETLHRWANDLKVELLLARVAAADVNEVIEEGVATMAIELEAADADEPRLRTGLSSWKRVAERELIAHMSAVSSSRFSISIITPTTNDGSTDAPPFG